MAQGFTTTCRSSAARSTPYSPEGLLSALPPSRRPASVGAARVFRCLTGHAAGVEGHRRLSLLGIVAPVSTRSETDAESDDLQQHGGQWQQAADAAAGPVRRPRRIRWLLLIGLPGLLVIALCGFGFVTYECNRPLPGITDPDPVEQSQAAAVQASLSAQQHRQQQRQ
jgi:hypothetical protein